MCPFAVLVFPIGDNITMLTTADWLLGSNSQSTAGLSTFSATMKGQYLVFTLTQIKALNVVDFSKPVPSLKKQNGFPKTSLKSKAATNLPQLLCLSLRNFVDVYGFMVFCFKHGLAPLALSLLLLTG